MAGDWIKMRTDLYRDPKVCLIADILMDNEGDLSRHVNQVMQRDMTVTRNVMRNVTVGSLVSVWGVLRHRGKRIGDDLIVKGCTSSVIDDVADLPGLGEAMQSVGWIEVVEEGIVLPRFFDEFNTDPADEIREKNAERQRRFREKIKAENRNVTVTLNSNAREEKSREEKREEKHEADASTPIDFIFATGKKLLGNGAGSVLGQARKRVGDEKVSQILAHMASMKPAPSDPIPYFVKATQPKVRELVL
jgi:hypothetical protein